MVYRYGDRYRSVMFALHIQICNFMIYIYFQIQDMWTLNEKTSVPKSVNYFQANLRSL